MTAQVKYSPDVQPEPSENGAHYYVGDIQVDTPRFSHKLVKGFLIGGGLVVLNTAANKALDALSRSTDAETGPKSTNLDSISVLGAFDVAGAVLLGYAFRAKEVISDKLRELVTGQPDRI